MKPWTLLLLAAGLAISFLPATAGAAGAGLAWRDWDSGLKQAKAAGRPVLVDVYTDWCGWCRRMDRDVYARADVRGYLADRFVTIKLDAEASGAARYEGKSFTQRSLAARFRVNGYPTTLFLRPGGEHLVSVPGYVPAARFLMLLRYVDEGHMDRGVTFQQYVERASSANPAQ